LTQSERRPLEGKPHAETHTPPHPLLLPFYSNRSYFYSSDPARNRLHRESSYLRSLGSIDGLLKTDRSFFATVAGETNDDLSYRSHWRFDFKYIVENKNDIEKNVFNRNSCASTEVGDIASVSEIVRLYEEYCRLESTLNDMRRKQNEIASKMKKSRSEIATKEGSKDIDPETRDQLIDEGKQLKKRVEELELQMTELLKYLQEEASRLPNSTHPETPIGAEPRLISTHKGTYDYSREATPEELKRRDHVTLGQQFSLLDFSSASSVTGAKFCYLRNEAAMLEIALVNWAMQKVTKKGYTPIITPDLAHRSMVEGCGFQPRGANSQIYSVEIGSDRPSSARSSNLCLVGTSEITLAGLYAGHILHEKDLPIKMVGFSHCFRAEAGSQGVSSYGLYRLHQFSKVEMFSITAQHDSDRAHHEMLEIERELLSELGLSFRVLDMPTFDLGAPAYRKFDIEAWMPSRSDWGEVTSTSNCTDYQSRRLGIRYRPSLPSGASGNTVIKSGNRNVKPLFAHTVNGTALAVPRIILSIMETCYDPVNDKITIPVPLRPFMGGIESIPSRS